MRLVKFGTIDLPQSGDDAEHSMPVKARSSLIDLPNGAFDQDGDKVILESSRISYRALVVNAIDATVKNLLKEVGKGRAVLRARLRDGVTEWVTFAKVTGVTRDTNSNDYEAKQPIVINWEQDYPYWLDANDGLYFDTGLTFDSGLQFDGHFESEFVTALPYDFTINNNGGARVPSGTLVITPSTASSVTNLKVFNFQAGLSVQYAGLLAAGQTLVIDFLTKTIEVDGTSVFNDLELGGSSQVEWMSLELDDNDIELTGTLSAGGSFQLYWRWQRHYL